MSDYPDNILADPRRQNNGLTLEGPFTVVLPPGTWVQIATPEPDRLTITVWPTADQNDIAVSPTPTGTRTATRSGDNRLPIQIHAAAYPLLTGGQWWAISTTGQTVLVWQVIREQ